MSEPSKYQQEADAFVQATGIKIAFQYVGHQEWRDAEPNRVPTARFRVTILREGRRPYSFDYWDSINDSYQWAEDDGRIGRKWGPMPYGLSGKVEAVSRRSPDDAMREAAAKGAAEWARYHVRRHTPSPTAYDVLACIEKHDPGTFEEFCANMDYSTDSIRARDTFLAVVDQWQHIRRLFSDEELERLQEIN